MRIHYLISLLTIMLSGVVTGQGTAIGKWKSYFPFRNVIDIVHNNGVAYGVTRNALIIRDFSDGSIERVTEVNGLSDIGISSVGYNTLRKAIIIGYENGNVDLIIDNVTTNLFQIKESGIIGNKTINHIFCKDNLAYLSCGFGIVVFNISKKEVKDTYIIGPSASQLGVNQLTINNGIIYAATDQGLYSANENSAFLTDFNSWSKSTSIPNPNNELSHISSCGDRIFVNSINSSTSDSLFVLKSGVWNRITSVNTQKNTSISAYSNTTLIVNQFDSIYILDTNYIITKTLTNYDGFWKPRCNEIKFDGSHYYLADADNAVARMTDNFVANFSNPGFLYSTNVVDIEIVDGHLWGASGAVVGGGWNKTFSNDGAFHYDIVENKWTQYNVHRIRDEFCFSSGCINDMVGMAVSEENPTKGFVCAFSVKGIAELQNEKVVAAYDSSNSSMQLSSVHNDRFAIKDATFDSDNNLWAVNSWSTNPLLLKTSSGSWKSFNLGTTNQNKVVASVTVDGTNGYKWIIYKDDKLIVYNDNGTLLDETDDIYKEIKNGAANGNLTSAPYAIAEDKDGEIWIGTDEGIFVLYNPTDIFSSSSFTVDKIKVTLDGNVEFLLENEKVTAIAVDGGNRKWIGTEGSGVFVISPDGTSQILRLNIENSPLLSNTINDIAIDGNTGEVFIATDKGLISYKGEATEPQPAFVDVYAYPNPVSPGYTGKIAIKGLMANSDVRITDITGNVVFNTTSIGGQAIWNGNKLDGTRASTGIYLVFMIAEDGSAKQVTKILFMN